MKPATLAALVAFVAFVAFVGCRKPPPAASPEVDDHSSAGGATPLDEQRPLPLVFCVDPDETSASEAAEALRSRLEGRDDLVITSRGDQVVVELPGVDETQGPFGEGRWCVEYEGRAVLCDKDRGAMAEFAGRHPAAVLSGPSK